MKTDCNRFAFGFSKSVVSKVALAAWFVLALALLKAHAAIEVTVTTPASASPCDSLSVTTRVVNIGNTLDQLQVSQFLPVAAYRYVPGSLRILQPDGTVTTDETVLTIFNGTNLVFDLSGIRSPGGPTNLLISEVRYANTNTGQWVEIYNPGTEPISMEGWSLRDARPGAVDALPTYVVAPNEFVVVAADTNQFLLTYPGLAGTLLQIEDKLIGNGLARYADGVFLVNSNSVVVDAMSYGFDTSGLNPAIPYVSASSSSAERRPANKDNNSRFDWIEQTVPNPGTGLVQSGLTTGGEVTIGLLGGSRM